MYNITIQMIYYSFYLDREKTQLVYRTQDITAKLDSGAEVTLSQFNKEINTLFEPEKSIPKIFSSEEGCKADFYKLLWDNPDYRYGETFGIKKEKKSLKGTKSPVISNAPLVHVSLKPPMPVYETLEINKVYNEDCLKTMARMPTGFVDYIITSPPYNAEKRISCGKNNKIYIGNEEMYSDYEDNLTPEQYEEWLFTVIRECIRVTKYHVFFNIQMLSRNKRTVLKIHGEFIDYIKDKIIWRKTIAAPNIVKGIMRNSYEDIFIFSNQNPESRNFEDVEFSGSFSNVIESTGSSKNKFAKINKATYPLYLPRVIINSFCTKGQLIYDPFNGTGTTGDACVIENMNYIASELDPAQCDITNQRIKDQSAKIKIPFA